MPRSDTSGDLFVGLMSGTSMDGVDAALVRFGAHKCELVASHQHAYPAALRSRLVACKGAPQKLRIDDFGELDSRVGSVFADAANALLAHAGVARQAITAIGSHGQTLRHRPQADPPFTLQIGDPNIIAVQTGITTVADFRRRDMAVGGGGAPLAPAFHQWLFGDDHGDTVILNLGGIANITILANVADHTVGFDTGPANGLLDAWISHVRGDRYDDRGRWAKAGQPIDALLAEMLGDVYLAENPPKSTGFEHFNLDWLSANAASAGGLDTLPAVDVQATLAEFSARTVADAVLRFAPAAAQILACGGGVHNDDLMTRLAARLPDCTIATTAVRGLHPDWVEAAAFAWLAMRALGSETGNLPSVTGASVAVILGGIYPAA